MQVNKNLYLNKISSILLIVLLFLEMELLLYKIKITLIDSAFRIGLLRFLSQCTE